MSSEDPGSLRDPFGSSEGVVWNSGDPFSSLRGPLTRSEGPSPCGPDHALRGPGSSGQSSVLSGAPLVVLFPRLPKGPPVSQRAPRRFRSTRKLVSPPPTRTHPKILSVTTGPEARQTFLAMFKCETLGAEIHGNPGSHNQYGEFGESDLFCWNMSLIKHDLVPAMLVKFRFS